MGAAVDGFVDLHTMANNFLTAVVAFGSELTDSALKAIKYVDVTIYANFKTVIVFIATSIALIHKHLLLGD